MEIKCRETIETSIKNHRSLSEKLHQETTKMVTDPAIVARLLKIHSPEKAAEALQKEIDGMVAQQRSIDQLLNKQVKSAIESAKMQSVPEAVRNFHKPADYQQQISNALAFLSLEGDGLTDLTAYAILKPFFNDWDQMHLFERAIMQKMHFEDAYSARTAFPKALGSVLGSADTHTALFGEAELIAETIFLYEPTPSTTGQIEGHAVFGGYGVDSYEHRSGQDRLIELAAHIDTLGSAMPFVYDRYSLNHERINSARHGAGAPQSDDSFVWL